MRTYRERKKNRHYEQEEPDPAQPYLDRLNAVLASEDDSAEPFPPALPALNENAFVSDFLSEMDARTTEAVCCVCQELVQASQTVTVDAVPNVELLRAPASAPAVDVVDGYYLERRGMTTHADGRTQYTCCTDCHSALTKKKLPCVAIANGLSFGAVPPALVGLTVVERILISPIVAKVNMLILKAVAGPGSSQRALKGHINAYPRDIVATNDALLPQPLAVLRDQIHVVLSRTNRPTVDELKRMLTCRQSRVRDAILCLVSLRSGSSSPSAYSQCRLDPARLAQLPEDAVPDEVLEGITEMDDAEEHAAHAGYAEGLNDVNPAPADDVIDASAHIDHLGTHVPPAVTTASAFQRLINPTQETPVEHRAHRVSHPQSGEPILIAPHLPTPVQQWNEAAYFIDIFAHHFPLGQGSPLADRPVKIALKRWVQHCIRHVDPRWRKDMAFIFVTLNVLLRNEAALNVFVRMRNDSFQEFERRFGHLTSDMLAAASHAKANPNAIIDPTIRDAVKFLAEKTDLVQANLPFTNANKLLHRRQMFSLMVALGLPVGWLTINPADIHSPYVLRLAKPDEDLTVPFSAIDSGKQARIVATNPYRATQYFHHTCDAFFDKLVHTLGNVKAYYGMVEAQGRGSLHIHVLVWIKGYTTVTQLAERLADPAVRAQMLQYADAFMCASIPEEPAAPMDVDGAPAAPTRPAVNAHLPREFPRAPTTMTPAELQDHHRALIQQNQMHDPRHNATCRKRNTTKCRFGFPFKPVAETGFSDKGELEVKRNAPYLTTHNPAIAFALNSNTHIMLLTLQRSARALPYYMSMYATKKTDLAHDWYAIAAEAFKRVEDAAVDDANPLPPERRSRTLLNKLNMASLRTLQIAAPEALTYLMDLKDSYHSHTFALLPIQVFVRWVNRTLEQQGDAPLDPRANSNQDDDADELRNDNNDDPDQEAVLTRAADRIVLQGSRVNDYIYRPNELSHLCLYDMTAAVTVDSAGRDKADADADVDTGPDQAFRLELLPQHPSAGRKICRIKRALVVPDLPYLPKSSLAAPEDNALYMLLLFKPFRTVADLKDPTQTWAAAWLAYHEALTPRLRQVHANIQELERGKEDKAREDEERRTNPDAEDDPESAGYRGDADLGTDPDDPDAPTPAPRTPLTTHGCLPYHVDHLQLDQTFRSDDPFMDAAIAAAAATGRFDAPAPPPDVSAADLRERVQFAAASFAGSIHRHATASVTAWKKLLITHRAAVETASSRQERFDFGAGQARPLERIDPVAETAQLANGPTPDGQMRELTVLDILGADGIPTLDTFIAQREPKLNELQEVAVRVIARHAIQTFKHVAQCG